MIANLTKAAKALVTGPCSACVPTEHQHTTGDSHAFYSRGPILAEAKEVASFVRHLQNPCPAAELERVMRFSPP